MPNPYSITNKRFTVTSNGSELSPKFNVQIEYTLHNGVRSEIVISDLGSEFTAEDMPDLAMLTGDEAGVLENLNT